MKQEYNKPQMTVFSNDPGAQRKDPADSGPSLTHRHILGLVEDAFAEISGDLTATIAVKRQVLEHLSVDNFTLALRTAIVGASRVATPTGITILDAAGVPEVGCGCTGHSVSTPHSHKVAATA